MENKTNKVIVLDDSREFLILRQAIYKKETYFIGTLLINDGEDFEKKSTILKYVNEDGKEYVEIVKDKEIIDIIMKYVK